MLKFFRYMEILSHVLCFLVLKENQTLTLNLKKIGAHNENALLNTNILWLILDYVPYIIIVKTIMLVQNSKIMHVQFPHGIVACKCLNTKTWIPKYK
jgi:hypothetical protein